MDMDQVACFLMLAEERHFGRAASRLGTTTSSLSKRCAKFEEELGVRLLERTSRQVRLTPEGNLLVEPARRVWAEMAEFKELATAAAGGRAGELMVTYSPGNGELLGGIIQAVRSTNPEVNFRLEQRISTEVGPAVLGGKASVGVCRAVTTKGLMALTLRRISRDHMAVPTDHVLADRDQIGLADLDGETLLASDTATRRWDWAAGVAVRSEHWSTESQVMDSVAAGRGLAIVDEGFIRRNPRPDVVTRPLASSLQPDPIEDYLVWRPDEPSEVARQFIDCAKALVAGGPDTGVEPAATLPRPRLTALPD